MSHGGCAVRVTMSASSRAKWVSRSRNHRRSNALASAANFGFPIARVASTVAATAA
ncbi:MAG TPA: hypothetical protein VHW73_12170 [Rudaea sp.]|nr:hypothetical protein [Rudaea sp.]